jgi:hypothetical protein
MWSIPPNFALAKNLAKTSQPDPSGNWVNPLEPSFTEEDKNIFAKPTVSETANFRQRTRSVSELIERSRLKSIACRSFPFVLLLYGLCSSCIKAASETIAPCSLVQICPSARSAESIRNCESNFQYSQGKAEKLVEADFGSLAPSPARPPRLHPTEPDASRQRRRQRHSHRQELRP